MYAKVGGGGELSRVWSLVIHQSECWGLAFTESLGNGMFIQFLLTVCFILYF